MPVLPGVVDQILPVGGLVRGSSVVGDVHSGDTETERGEGCLEPAARPEIAGAGVPRAFNRVSACQQDAIPAGGETRRDLMDVAVIRQHSRDLSADGQPKLGERNDVRRCIQDCERDQRHASRPAAVEDVPCHQFQ